MTFELFVLQYWKVLKEYNSGNSCIIKNRYERITKLKVLKWAVDLWFLEIIFGDYEWIYLPQHMTVCTEYVVVHHVTLCMYMYMYACIHVVIG